MAAVDHVQNPVVTFTVIAYAISWLCWLPLLADRQNLVGWSASTYLHLLGASARPSPPSS